MKISFKIINICCSAIFVLLFIIFVPKEVSAVFNDYDTLTGYKNLLEAQTLVECTVTFDLNGGMYDGEHDNIVHTYQINSHIDALNKELLYRNNCSFIAWKTIDGVSWDFNEDVITEDIILRAEWNWDETNPIYYEYDFETLGTYFYDKYYGMTDYWQDYAKSIKDVTGTYLVEMQSADFTEEEIIEALIKSGSRSTYGGCGPIAMMGILHFLSDSLGYSQIINDPNDSLQRIALAYDVLINTPTFEIGLAGDKSTLTWPADVVSSFNYLLNQYGYGDKIVATHHGTFTSYDSDIAKIKESIDKGLPVTLYTGLAGDGWLGSHYVNLFGYEDWMILDRDGKYIKNTVFMMRMNWGWSTEEDKISYIDADILKNNYSGIIYYEIQGYDNVKKIEAKDFASTFINLETGQGQYFFTPISAMIVTSSGYSFNTNRLRCSYIENQYLVLSAHRANAGMAYLEMYLEQNIRAINFDMSLWGGNELLNFGGFVGIDYYDGEKWISHIEFDIEEMSTLRDYPKNYLVFFPRNVNAFRYRVTKNKPSGDRNKGRVVIDNIEVYYDNIA